jgi:hypothetical protein
VTVPVRCGERGAFVIPMDDHGAVTKLDPRTRRAVLAAYHALLAGDAGPLVEQLARDVEWNDFSRSRRVRTLRGRDAVADHLRASARRGQTIDLRGLTIRTHWIGAEFAMPWWRAHPRRRAAIAAVVGGTFSQALTLGDGVERIDNREAFFVRLAPEPHEQHEMLASLLGR